MHIHTTTMLGQFLQDMLYRGEAVVENELQQFNAADHAHALQVLEKYYAADTQNMPGNAPEFNAPAALWGSATVYYAMQFLLLRNLTAEQVSETLKPFAHSISPAEVYSADMALRYLPDLINAAKGLAPDDPLVARLNEIAIAWPFSSVGVKLNTAVPLSEVIKGSASLQTEYIDRIVAKRDKYRLADNETKLAVTQALGQYSEQLWPGYKELI